MQLQALPVQLRRRELRRRVAWQQLYSCSGLLPCWPLQLRIIAWDWLLLLLLLLPRALSRSVGWRASLRLSAAQWQRRHGESTLQRRLRGVSCCPTQQLAVLRAPTLSLLLLQTGAVSALPLPL